MSIINFRGACRLHFVSLFKQEAISNSSNRALSYSGGVCGAMTSWFQKVPDQNVSASPVCDIKPVWVSRQAPRWHTAELTWSTPLDSLKWGIETPVSTRTNHTNVFFLYMLILPAHVAFFPNSVCSPLPVMLWFCVLNLYLKPYFNVEGDAWEFFFFSACS